MTNEERRKAADDLAKTWCSRPNTVRGTRRLEVTRGGPTAPGGGGEDAEPVGSWGDVREVSRTRKGATAPCTPWTPLLGRQWVMPADLVDFEHYATAQPGEKFIEDRQPSTLDHPQPSNPQPQDLNNMNPKHQTQNSRTESLRPPGEM
jgi:hypothetical protein